ncbi:MAG: lysoplasmalogenase [Acidimicrobiia bacterium]|nr:lysoplasmalogenase [Acidimicrobiia bacterium]
MTTGAWTALAVATAFALANWYSRLRHDRTLQYVTKPAALVALVAVAVLLDPADPTRRAWFVAALICGLAGDVFLMLPSDRFVAGLASFLVGHVLYVAGFMTDPRRRGRSPSRWPSSPWWSVRSRCAC